MKNRIFVRIKLIANRKLMGNTFYIYNTLSRQKELFVPHIEGKVGLYVCGPTVYGDAHLGHARPAITFDVLFRYLIHLGYKVRYVRNITDVGHLQADADEGEDKIGYKARLEQIEPMEVVTKYTNSYHRDMDMLNVLRPSIEPTASGHILEQQEMIQKILDNGYAYESQGSVYFDVEKYNKDYHYGKLSGRKIEDLYSNTRQLDGQSEKRSGLDFALWKKAEPEHLMRWNSPWSIGFPGWHLECSCMSEKYLGKTFDIHGGGLDLQFPHHECEIAQSVASNGKEAVRYWMHNNMITINKQKMGKSLGNFINLQEMFTGKNTVLEQAYSPMTIRFFILQAHYRSPLDFSNEALQASEKGLERLLASYETLQRLQVGANETNVGEMVALWEEALADDLNTPILIAHLFDTVRVINSIASGKQQIDSKNLELLQGNMAIFLFDILGLKRNEEEKETKDISSQAIELLLALRQDAKKAKDYELSDKIRNELAAMGVLVKDTKDGVEWQLD